MKVILATLREVWPGWLVMTAFTLVTWHPLGAQILCNICVALGFYCCLLYSLETFSEERRAELYRRRQRRLSQPDVLPPVVAYVPRARGEG